MTQTERLQTPEPFYHVCFLVPNLDVAMAEMTAMIDASWGEPMEGLMGEWSYRIVFTDSLPAIELIQGQEGSPWYTQTTRFHHLGWWKDSLEEAANRWSDEGASITLDGRELGRRFLYAQATETGLTYEVVSNLQKDDFLKTWIVTDSGKD